MPWFWARVHDRTQQLGYLRGGFQLLYFALSDAIRKPGGQTRSAPRSHRSGPMATRSCRDRSGRSASTTSSRRCRPGCRPAWCRGLPAGWRDRHEWGVPRRPLRDARPRSPLTSSLLAEHQRPRLPVPRPGRAQQLQSSADYGGLHLRLPRQLSADDDPPMTSSATSVLADFLPHLARVNPEFDPSWLTVHGSSRLPTPSRSSPSATETTSRPSQTPIAERLAGEHVPGLPPRPRPELLDCAGRAPGRPFT